MNYLIDTNIYIEFLRNGAFHKTIEDLYSFQTPRIYFSSVVVQELLAGAIGKKGRDNVENLYRPFERGGRIIIPSFKAWKDAGNILSTIRQNRKDLKSKMPLILNDTLIAISAKNIGAKVYTSNADDFQVISSFIKFSFVVI